MSIVGPIVRNDFFFFVTILALAALMVLFEVKRRQPAAPPRICRPTPQGGLDAPAASAVDGIGVCQLFCFYRARHGRVYLHQERERACRRAAEVTFVNGQLSIPLAQVSDGDLHRFRGEENGTEVRFWLYQKPDGKVATVFDACEICGAAGFYKGPNGVVCKNCAAPINGQSVGTKGGCNPVPLTAEQTADAVIIKEADIAAGAHMFQK